MMLGQTGRSQTLVITQLVPLCTAHLLISMAVGISHVLSLLVIGRHDPPGSWLLCLIPAFNAEGWRESQILLSYPFSWCI